MGEFEFGHPGLGDDFKEWARQLVEEQMGAEHCADLDWENCEVRDDEGCW